MVDGWRESSGAGGVKLYAEYAEPFAFCEECKKKNDRCDFFGSVKSNWH